MQTCILLKSINAFMFCWQGSRASRRWHSSQDHIKPCRPLSETFALDGLEVEGHIVALSRGFNSIPEAILGILWVPLDVALRGEQFLATSLDLEVDVGRPPGVRNRLDGTKQVFAGAAGQKSPKTLKVLVSPLERISAA